MTPPPINIDGTNENYSNVTIDGQDVTQITIDGQDVLSAIPDSANLQYRYEAPETDTLLSGGSAVNDGDPIDEWETLVGSEHLTGGSPTRNDNGIGSDTSVSFDPTDDRLVSQSASNWAFLHDGSAFTLYVVVKNAASSGLAGILMTQGAYSSGAEGSHLVRDADNDELIWRVSNGSDWIIGTLTASFPSGSDEIYAIVHDPDAGDEYAMHRGTTQTDTQSVSGGHGSGDPVYPATMGDPQNTSAPMDGEMGAMLPYTAAHDSSTRSEVVDYLNNLFGISA